MYISEINNGLSGLISKRFAFLRKLLLLSYKSVGKGAGLSASTIKNLEMGIGAASISTIISLLNFYCISYLDFFDPAKPLPSEEQLRKKMEADHKEQNLIAYKVIIKKIRLIDLIESYLLDSVLFEDWVIEEDVFKYISKQHKLYYANIENTLDRAVEKEWLELKLNSSPRAYRKKI